MNRGSSVPDDATVVRGYLPIGTNLPLTDRERTILQLITEGMSNREIAEYLILSPTTVKWYIKQIFNKLGANRRTQAVKIASEIHLTEIAPQYDPRPNIPAPALKLIGREKETLEVINLLDDPAVRLVTILGPGGIGKTRLAVEIAQQRAKQMPGQVCFAILDSVGTLAGLIQAVASAIGFQFHGKTEIGQQLLFGLRKRRLLLVMDSLEHLPEAGQLINRMLVAAPQLKILATSRERLSLTIETIYSLRGLDYPMTTSYSQDYAAFMLFMNIARFSQPVFRPSDDDTVHICRICQIVEGMPLAIELAARWIDLLTPEQIAEEISQGINILRTSLQDVPERHRNIHAVFERSWRLLSDEEREVFKNLSVFCGGIDRTAAEQVAGATLFMLSTLVDKSLLMRVGVDRYKPHELVRQFALEKLQENAGEYKDTLQNLCQYYARLMERYERAIKTDVSMLSDCVLKTFIDFDNILLGWNQALESLRVPEIVNYAFNINLCFTARGLTAAGINMFEQVLQLFDAHADLVEPIERVSVATFLGWSLLNHGLYERARQVMESAAEYISAVDNPDEDVGLLQGLWGWALYLTGQPNAGRSHAQEGLQICQSANFHFGVLLCLLILAEIEHAEECFEGAYHYLHEAMVLSERYRDSFVIAHTFAHLGHVCCMLGKVDDGVDYLRRGLALNRNTLIVAPILLTILGIACLHELRGQPDAALEILAIFLYHPQYGGSTSVVEPAKRILLSRLRSRLSENQINTIMAKAKHHQLSGRYLDSQFTASPELIDRLLELLDQVARA